MATTSLCVEGEVTGLEKTKMHASARIVESEQGTFFSSWQGIATVVRSEDALCWIRCTSVPGSSLGATSMASPARRAVSCLIQPQGGDRVWAVHENDEWFVTAVLERKDSNAELELQAEGNIVLHSKKGEVAVRGQSLALQSDTLKVHASEAQLSLAKLIHIGQSVVSYATTVKFVFKSLESIAERCLARFKRSYRFVEEVEQVRAKEIDLRAQSNVQLRSKNTFVSAESLVKIDGGQIHLG